MSNPVFFGKAKNAHPKLRSHSREFKPKCVLRAQTLSGNTTGSSSRSHQRDHLLSGFPERVAPQCDGDFVTSLRA